MALLQVPHFSTPLPQTHIWCSIYNPLQPCHRSCPLMCRVPRYRHLTMWVKSPRFYEQPQSRMCYGNAISNPYAPYRRSRVRHSGIARLLYLQVDDAHP